VLVAPRTAVGRGNERIGDAGAGALLDGVGDGPDGVAEFGGGEVVTVAAEDCVGADADVLWLATAEGPVGAVEVEALGSAAGLSAIDPVEDAANTAAPSATSPTRTAIGRSPIRRPRGRRARQFGQKPETGVVT